MTTTTSQAAPDYIAVPLQSLRLGSVPDFSLYMRVDSKCILYRDAHLPFKEEHRHNLLESMVTHLYISAADSDRYHEYIEKHLPDIVADPILENDVKARILYDTALNMLRTVLREPLEKEEINRGRNFVESAMRLVLLGRGAVRSLIQVMSFDYSLYTHSINVCALSLGLGQMVGVTDMKELSDLGTGALLHDIGKVRVPEEIIRKRGKLTAEDWTLVKRHPVWGVDMVTRAGLDSEPALLPIEQHHERENGSGYPYGLPHYETHKFSKIVGMADAYDAMTTDRVYKRAVSGFDAIQEMMSDEGAFDPELLGHLIRLVGPTPTL